MHGGVKFYRGSAAAARSYVEADRSRVDDYYLAEGTGLATGTSPASRRRGSASRRPSAMDGPAYERWVAGYDVDDRRSRRAGCAPTTRGLRFVEVVVNGPKTWSLAAALHPEIAAAYDAAQDRAAAEIIGWLAEHATTRVGPRGRQVQVPVEQLEAAVVRHYTSRAGDPHRHLHLQINARVFAAGRWRGLHSVGVVDSIEAINGIGHAAVMCDPEFRDALAAHGYTLDPDTGEIAQLAPYVGAFSARAVADRPERRPVRGRVARRAPGRRARPAPAAGLGPAGLGGGPTRQGRARPTATELAERWREELRDLGFTPPTHAPRITAPTGTPIGRINRDAVVDLVLTRLGARRSAWNAADIRGEVERIIAAVDVVAARRGAPRAGRGPHQPHRRDVRAAAGPRRRARARPRAHLPAGARRRGRPRRPARRPRRAPGGALLGSARWSPDARLDPAQQRRWSPRWPAPAAAGHRGRGRRRQDHHPGRRPRPARDAARGDWWWSPRP